MGDDPVSRAAISARRRLACVLPLVLGVFSLSVVHAQEDLPDLVSEMQRTEADANAEANAEAQLPEPNTAPTEVSPSVADAQPVVAANGASLSETPRRLHYTINVGVREVYDDNVNLSHAGTRSDYYTSFEATIRLSLGDTAGEGSNSIAFTYGPQVVLYTENSNNDSVQHLIRLEAQHVFGKLTLGLTEDVRILDGTDLRSLNDTTGRVANVDVAARARQDIISTRLAASYSLSSKTFLSSNLEHTRYSYDGPFVSSDLVSADLFLNYTYSPKLVGGVGTTFGYNATDDSSSDQQFEQVNVRATYSPGEKLKIAAAVGFEFRQFDDESAGTRTSPVYSLTAKYTPFDGTVFSLDGSRRSQNSAAIAGTDFTDTDVHFTLQQRFFQRVFASISAGYINLEYFSTSGGATIDRSDDYLYFQAAIDGNITRFWSAGVYYLYREDFSTVDAFSFSDNQLGFRTSLTF